MRSSRSASTWSTCWPGSRVLEQEEGLLTDDEIRKFVYDTQRRASTEVAEAVRRVLEDHKESSDHELKQLEEDFDNLLEGCRQLNEHVQDLLVRIDMLEKRVDALEVR